MKTINSDLYEKPPLKKPSTHIDETIRNEILDFAKDFKTSWINLGRHLYAVYQDKLYHAWGFENFEDYLEQEVGLNKQVAMKLLKSYIFIEQEEPDYLNHEFNDKRDANKVPPVDAINFLRLAKRNKDVLKDDYRNLKMDLFEKGKDLGVARKELTALIRERKAVDPEEERENRNRAAIQRVLTALNNFDRDMTTLKLIPHDLIEEAKSLAKKLEKEMK